MSAPEERQTLVPRPSLYAYARGRLDAEPDGRSPAGCYPAPAYARPQDDAGPSDGDTPLPYREALAAVRDALGPLLGSPDADHVATTALMGHRLAALPVSRRTVAAAVAELPLGDEAAARALGRHLVRTGTQTRTVVVGLALLRRLGEAADVPDLKVVGVVRGLTTAAVLALERLDRRAAALLELTSRAARPELRELVDAFSCGDQRAAAVALVKEPLDIARVDASQARLFAEAAGLAGLLRREHVPPRLLAQAARLLVRMASRQTYRAEILRYADAVEVYEALVRRASGLAPTGDRAALLLSLALDLDSGSSHLLPWREGQREQLFDSLGALLTSPEWAALPDQVDAAAPPRVRHRAAWLRVATERLFAARPDGAGRLRIEVVVTDPVEREPVETRFLVDGRPLVPEAFGRGAGHSPEFLLDGGGLRATGEPREVQLAEAWCTEGCCGALWVTVVREGDEVVWRDWRRPTLRPDGSVPPELPAYRFDAAAYDAELARAGRDTDWSWPARETGRLLGEELRRRPELLARWDARLTYAGVDARAPYTPVLWFVYRPGTFEGEVDEDGPWLRFVWRLPDGDTDPGEQVAQALRRLADEDPRGYAECCGGSRRPPTPPAPEV